LAVGNSDGEKKAYELQPVEDPGTAQKVDANRLKLTGFNWYINKPN
jgi:hypothetical protein